MSMSEFLADETALDRFLRDFEAGVLPKEQFGHRAHLAVAACYLLTHSDDEAYRLVRKNIRAYNEAVGGKNTEDAGYHETITIFWLRVVRRALPEGAGRLEAVRGVVERFGERRDLFREYYSFDVLKSREARRGWVAPDRQPDGM